MIFVKCFRKKSFQVHITFELSTKVIILQGIFHGDFLICAMIFLILKHVKKELKLRDVEKRIKTDGHVNFLS